MKMTKYDKVNNALMKKTEDSENWIGISMRRDGRHVGCKYTIQNVITKCLHWQGYKTLKEIIKEYDLTI